MIASIDVELLQPFTGVLHHLKTVQPFYTAVAEGKKTFEIRKNDRGYKVGDILHLREWDLKTGYTGRSCFRQIVYILNDDDFIVPGKICMGMLPVSIDTMLDLIVEEHTE